MKHVFLFQFFVDQIICDNKSSHPEALWILESMMDKGQG